MAIDASSPTGGLTRPTLLRPLRDRDFRLLWGGQAVSLLGDQFHMIALAWLVLTLTGSGLALGLVLVAASIPRAILMVVGGALADRIPPRRLILASDLARGAVVAVIAMLVLTGHVELWHLVVMGIAFGVADALFFPAMNTIVPLVVPTERLAAANGLVQGTAQLTNLVGPVLAGLLVVAVGTGAAFAVDAVSFAIAAVAVAAIRTGRPAPASERPLAEPAVSAPDTNADAAPATGIGADIRAGIRYAATDPTIRTLLILSAVFNLAINGPLAVGLPWLASQRFASDAAVFGAMIAGFGLGAIAGAIVAGSIKGPRRGGTFLLAVATTLGIGLGAIGLAPSALAVMAILAVMGLGVGYLNVVLIAWLQAYVAPDMLGRVMGLVMLASFGLGPLSLALAGVLVDVSATALFLIAGALIVAVGGLSIATGAAARLDLRDAATDPSADPLTA